METQLFRGGIRPESSLAITAAEGQTVMPEEACRDPTFPTSTDIEHTVVIHAYRPKKP